MDLDVEVPVYSKLAAFFEEQKDAGAGEGDNEKKQDELTSLNADKSKTDELAGLDEFNVRDSTLLARISDLQTENRLLDLVLAAESAISGFSNQKHELAGIAELAAELAVPARETSNEFCIQACKALDEVIAPESTKRAQELRALLDLVEYPFTSTKTTKSTTSTTSNTASAWKSIKQVSTELGCLNPALLYAVFARPLNQRIAFHFGEGKDTRDEEKPEWLFQYTLTLLGPVDLKLKPLKRCVNDLIPGIVKSVFPALEKLVCEVYKLNSHTVHELIKFCSNLETQFYIKESLTTNFINSLLTPPLLPKYLSLERDFYIMNTSLAIEKSSHAIDFDAQVTSSKPTFCAQVVWQLVRKADELLRLDCSLVFNEVQAEVLQTYLQYLTEQLGAVKTDLETGFIGSILGAASFIVYNLQSYILENAALTNFTDVINPVLSSFLALKLESVRLLAGRVSERACTRLRHFATHYAELVELASVRALLAEVNAEFKYIRDLTATCRADNAFLLAPISRDVAVLLFQRVLTAHTYREAEAEHLQTVCELVFTTWQLPLTYEANRLFQGLQIVAKKGGEVDLLSEDEIRGLEMRVVH